MITNSTILCTCMQRYFIYRGYSDNQVRNEGGLLDNDVIRESVCSHGKVVGLWLYKEKFLLLLLLLVVCF